MNSKRHFSIFEKNRKTGNIGEFKPDVYGRRQTVNISSVFLFFSCLSLNKSYKNRNVSLAIYCKYKYFDSTVQRAEDTANPRTNMSEKIVDTNWIMTALHYVNCQLCVSRDEYFVVCNVEKSNCVVQSPVA